MKAVAARANRPARDVERSNESTSRTESKKVERARSDNKKEPAKVPGKSQIALKNPLILVLIAAVLAAGYFLWMRGM